ncbi:MAG: SirB2 family protein, partial [Thiohalomonadales bacterium]
MGIIKTIHIAMAFLSISGFIIRGIWMMQQSDNLKEKWVKVLPHIIDTFLLLSALILAINLSINPLEQYWLMSKIIALFVYIGLGMVALRFGKTLLQ